MKPCDRYEEMISRLVDEELNREEYDALIAHIGECSRCNALYAAFNAMSDLMREEPAPLPEGLHENIMAGVRRSAIEKKNRRMRVVWTRTALTAAACLALVLFASRGFAPDEKAESVALRSAEAAEEIIPAAPMNEAALPDAIREEAAVPAEPSAAPEPKEAPAATPVPVLEGNPAPLPSPSATPVAASGAQSPTGTESQVPSTAAAPAPEPSAAPEPEEAPAATLVPTLEGNPAPLPSPESQTKADAAKSDAAAAEPTPAAELNAASAESAEASKPQASAAPAAESESPAAEAEKSVQAAASGRKGLRSLFKMPSLSPMSEAEQGSGEESAAVEPTPSEEPSPSPSPTPSAEPSPGEAITVVYALAITRDADFDALMALLDLRSAPEPEDAPSRIYMIRYTPERKDAAQEEMEISVVGDAVYCLRSVGGTEKCYRAGCGADELKTLIRRIQTAETPAPEESAPLLPDVLQPKPAAAPAPSGTSESAPKAAEMSAAHVTPAESEK